MTRALLVSATALFGALGFASSAAQTNVLAGDWHSEGATVRIAPCARGSALMCGTVVEHRPESGARDAIGFVVLSNLVRTSSGWSGRSSDGEGSYAATLRIDGDLLTLRSCLAPGLCETDVLRRLR